MTPTDDAEADADSMPPPEQETARPRRVGLFVAVALAALAIDIVTKLLVVANLENDQSPDRVLGGVLYFDVARNCLYAVD